MKEKFKGYLLVTDMDGTLLDSKGRLSEENIKAIEYFVNNGGIFTIATGRMLPSAQRFINKIKINAPIILYNGSKVYDYKPQEVIYEKYLEEDRKSVIQKVAKDYQNLGVEIYSEENIYIYRKCEYTNRLSKKGYDVIEKIEDKHWKQKWIKVLFIGNKFEIDKLEEEFELRYDTGTVIRSGEKFLELTCNETSKGQALRELANKIGIQKEKIIAIGDNMNDLEMIQYAEFGFAVQNGNKKLVEKAKLIAPTNDNNCIKYVVDWINEKNCK